MKYHKIFVSAVLAGVCIGIGGTVFLSLDNKVIGAMLFTVGLFVICTFGLHLFTGKVCYAFQNDKGYALSLPVIWLGNLAGTGLTALAVRASRVGPALAEKAAALCAAKTEDSYVSLFALGVLCNILIYIAVEGYNRSPYEMGRYLSLFFGVMVFILCGTEHCVADMFYFWLGGWSVEAVPALLIVTLGNAAGGELFPVAREWLAAEK